ncbi:dihydrofolate reductase family protein [Corynebacterium kozikiae]|uniref:dihydrofolate reductase family protein n=1 Tax=Corynebacterium kozikiae TaxID=2968469 RepID=UPI00211BB4FB|nr:dihydrofolate reductase family protein [Corynebacterium sp. 76QC2CO]MCQ9343383.1 dihydrofolate reductase family protein [Corynebacterium sp. 76QC2CO]
MREIIVTAFISLDGVMEAPGGEPGYRNTGWTTQVELLPEAYEIKGREQQEAGAMLLGRNSYQAFAPIWPTMEEFAEYNAMPRYVVSTTLEEQDAGWPATILRSIDEVRELKERTGGGPILVHGSATLGKSLAEAGLVDRYHLLVFPVLLGAGKRLFTEADLAAQWLELVEHEAYPNGVVKYVYNVARP